MTACTALAPLYYRAMQQSLTQITIAQAPVITTSLQLSSSPDDGFYSAAPLATPEQIAAKLPRSFRASYHPPILGYTANSGVLPAGPSQPAGDLVWRDGACEHVSFS